MGNFCRGSLRDVIFQLLRIRLFLIPLGTSGKYFSYNDEICSSRCRYELIVEFEHAIMGMRLKDADEPVIGIGFFEPFQSCFDLIWMMPVIIDDKRSFFRGSFHFSPSPASAISCE